MRPLRSHGYPGGMRIMMKEILEQCEYEVEEEERVGRQSIVRTTKAVLEVSRFAGNTPNVSVICDVQFDRDSGRIVPVTDWVACANQVRHGDNGYARFHLAPNRLYLLSDVLCASNRRKSYKVATTESGVSTLEPNPEDVYAKVFPAGFENAIRERNAWSALTDRAGKILAAVADEQRGFPSETVDGIVATPEFNRPPDTQTLAGQLEGSALSDDELVMSMAAPTRYVVSSPVFAEGESAEAAISIARAKFAERQAEQNSAVDEANAAGLPELSGTERQVAWALKIRAELLRRNPDDPRLKRKTAKFWIENRSAFQSRGAMATMANPGVHQ